MPSPAPVSLEPRASTVEGEPVADQRLVERAQRLGCDVLEDRIAVTEESHKRFAVDAFRIATATVSAFLDARRQQGEGGLDVVVREG
jgi:hypothetical protein